MSTIKQSWAGLLRLQGPDYLAWLTKNQVLQTKFDTLSNALWSLLCSHVYTPEHAVEVWNAVPSVICRCSDQDTYKRSGAGLAYAWLYFLERYVRTWIALDKLVEQSCIPMAKFEVRALDVGTGPGSSAFAVHDYFVAMTDFSNETGNLKWRQPPKITCVEFDHTTNHLRHFLAEIVYEQSAERENGVLAMCSALPDFQKVLPTVERKKHLAEMRNEEDQYYDEVTGEWSADLRYSPDEASYISQSLHRYRLFTFSNFLTTVDTLEKFRLNLVDILEDAAPGSVIMTLGGRGGPYPEIHTRMDDIAKSTGFEQTVASHDVSIKDSVVEDRVYQEGQRFYKHLQSLAPNPNKDAHTQTVCSYFDGHRDRPRSSRLIAYKKFRNQRSR